MTRTRLLYLEYSSLFYHISSGGMEMEMEMEMGILGGSSLDSQRTLGTQYDLRHCKDPKSGSLSLR